jgi:hypothetical protein
VEKGFRRRGLGRHLLVLLELIARQQKIELVSVPVQFEDKNTLAWVSSVRGFLPDTGLKSLVDFGPDLEVTAHIPYLFFICSSLGL